MEEPDDPPDQKHGTRLSLRMLLLILFFALVIAASLAYMVVNPFFHQHPM